MSGEEIFRLCGVAVICAIVGALLGRVLGDMSVAVRLGALALCFGGVALLLLRVVDELGEWGLGADTAEYVSLMLRGLGVVTICRICADICRDCGENTVASTVESGGKLALVALSLPTVKELISFAVRLMEKI